MVPDPREAGCGAQGVSELVSACWHGRLEPRGPQGYCWSIGGWGQVLGLWLLGPEVHIVAFGLLVGRAGDQRVSGQVHASWYVGWLQGCNGSGADAGPLVGKIRS